MRWDTQTPHNLCAISAGFFFLFCARRTVGGASTDTIFKRFIIEELPFPFKHPSKFCQDSFAEGTICTATYASTVPQEVLVFSTRRYQYRGVNRCCPLSTQSQQSTIEGPCFPSGHSYVLHHQGSRKHRTLETPGIQHRRSSVPRTT